MTYFIVWSTWLNTNWVIATRWQNYRMAPCVFFSHTSGWVADSFLKMEIFFITSNHLILRECACCCKMNQPSERRRFIQSSEIAKLFLDTDSGDTTVSSDSSSVEGGLECVPGVSHAQTYRQTASSPKPSSSISSSASDEDEAVEIGPGEQTRQAVTLQWTPLLPSEQCSTHI